MEASKRRKKDDTPVQEKAICIIHSQDVKSDDFTFIINTKKPKERFQKNQSVKKLRQSQPYGSPYRMNDICKQIPDECENNHGYHRACYSRFTAHLNRLRDDRDDEQPSTSQTREPRRSSVDKDKTIFNPDCLFCRKQGRKKLKVKGIWTTEDTTVFERGGGESIIKLAEEKGDFELLGRISGFDLFACEAKFHPSCRRSYMLCLGRTRSQNQESSTLQAALEKAHGDAFEKVCSELNEEVVLKQRVVRLSDLRKMYIAHLSETTCPNPNYRGEKLKAKIQKHPAYQGILGFCVIDRNSPFSSYLVFNVKMDIQEAIRSSYTLGQNEKVDEVAKLLRNELISRFSVVEEMPWPTTVNDLNLTHSVIPHLLEKFLTIVLSGDKEPSRGTSRIVNSIGQDICRAVTNGKWKLPKHIVLGMALRHLFRSAELIVILNRLGHCENYSFLLELETALAVAVESASSLLPPSIIRHPSCPSVFHSDFDNFDVFVNDLYGAGSVHRAHGIILQDLNPDQGGNIGGTQPVMQSTARTGQRSLRLVSEQTLPECYMGKRKSPQFEVVKKLIDDGERAHAREMQRNFLWILVRLHSAIRKQRVPGWGGYVSLTGDAPVQLTTIEYYPIIPQPITDIRVIQECLKYSEEASQEVGQHFVITTFDLGVCMKAFPLVWSNKSRYENHIIMIGTFHLACGYLKMLGKKMDGTGFAEILLEAGLTTSGSLMGVITAKNYARSLNCHKVLMEALERLVLACFLQNRDEEVPFGKLEKSSRDFIERLATSPSKETENAALNDQDICSYIEEYLHFRENIRSGQHGKTAALWMSYIDHAWLTMCLLQAVKTNNFTVYAQCLCLMPDLFFSFGGHNYARYLTFYSMFIANIELSHPGAEDLLKRGAISVARSLIPGNRCAVDKTIEETFMKHANSKGGSGSIGAGISGLQTNYSAYQRWTKSGKERAKFLQATFCLAGMLDEEDKGLQHRDVRPSEIATSEKLVSRTIAAIKCFNNPFNIPDDGKLYNLSSGAPASEDVAKDVLTAETVGRLAKEDFIEDRLMKKDGFFDPIKRPNLKTMAHMHKSVKLSTSHNKVVEYKQQGHIAFHLLVKSQTQSDRKLDLDKLVTYPLTPVPYSIGLADGFLAKTDKSKGFKHIVKECDDAQLPDPRQSFIIEDGNAVFHCLREIPLTFGEISRKLLGSAIHLSPVIFSTDMYKEDSVKWVERNRQGVGDKLILSGEKTKRPKDWKVFLANDENKTQFVQLLLSTWRSDESVDILVGHEIVLVCEGKAYQLTSDGHNSFCKEIHSLESSQEETDTRVILYCMYAKERGCKSVRVRSPDSDIFFILLHHARFLEGIQILFETGKGNTRRCIDVTKLARSFTPVLCSAMLGYHAFTGCDSTSAFKGKGKVKGLKVVETDESFQKAFSKLGESWEVDEEVMNELERFTCVLYGNKRTKRVNTLRFVILQTKCGGKEDFTKSKQFDLASLPPCRMVLEQHIQRSNFQTRIWKLANIAKPSVPKPDEGHGWTVEAGVMKPKWTEGEVMPRQLVDILEEELKDETCASESDPDSDNELCESDFLDRVGSDSDIESDGDD